MNKSDMNLVKENSDHLQWQDYFVFIAMLLISLLIGIYHRFSGGRQRTTAEYLLADSSMSVWPVAFSLMASFMSAITLLGVSSEIYFYGTQFIVINLSYAIGTPITAFVFLPVFYKLKLTSVYEMIFYNSIVLYAPALVLSAVTGVSRWTAIISVGLVCTIYCTIGGMKAVLWTDVFQSILMFTAMLVIIIKGSIDVGGLDVVFNRAKLGSRLEFFNIDPDPTVRHTFWSLTIGGLFIYLSIYGVNQTQVQRLMTVKNIRQSQKAMFLSWPLTSLISLTTALTGLVIYANFYKDDPLKCGHITKPDQLLPYYAVSKLSAYPGLPGLIIAGIFSGSLSTVSSFVNSLSAVTLEDYLKPIFKHEEFFKSNEIIITKLLTLIYGLICLILTVLADRMNGLLQASLTLFGVIGGPLLMIFTAGMCFRRINSTGAASGFILCLIFGLWVGFGSMLYGRRPQTLPLSTDLCSNKFQNDTLIPYFKPRPTLPQPSNLIFYNLSYLWTAAYCWIIGLAVALITSHLTRNKDSSTSTIKMDPVDSDTSSSMAIKQNGKII
ncbi:sodium-dependent multivitamin transporter-like protein [Sarcoptes scabiei]|uniref:Sodium-dependent multivitamin transporter-like protein n=1 Tax=Sarcoptes scabiei TaxID=52283 RepID=A0A132AD86_SARSC|nr:sodium-dependent multivitamin transporter-like protein [Sarcoptes scabiei]